MAGVCYLCKNIFDCIAEQKIYTNEMKHGPFVLNSQIINNLKHFFLFVSNFNLLGNLVSKYVKSTKRMPF